MRAAGRSFRGYFTKFAQLAARVNGTSGIKKLKVVEPSPMLPAGLGNGKLYPLNPFWTVHPLILLMSVVCVVDTARILAFLIPITLPDDEIPKNYERESIYLGIDVLCKFRSTVKLIASMCGYFRLPLPIPYWQRQNSEGNKIITRDAIFGSHKESKMTWWISVIFLTWLVSNNSRQVHQELAIPTS